MRKREKNSAVFQEKRLSANTGLLNNQKASNHHKGKKAAFAIASTILSFSLNCALPLSEMEGGLL